MKCYVLFETTHMALLFERACREAGLAAKIVPVPRSLSTSCGMACLFPCDQKPRLNEILSSKHIEISGFYELDS